MEELGVKIPIMAGSRFYPVRKINGGAHAPEKSRKGMKNIILAILLVTTTFGLYGCAHHHHSSYVRDSAERVKAADWSKMETVTVVMSDFAFNPATPVFRQGVPYKLVIENKGVQKHYFTAESFFRAIATRKLQSNADGEIKAPYFSAIEVYPGRSLDLYFIPVKTGTYDLICTIEGHVGMGMKGTIRIE
jgi:uncharacterized cupredoxin-like copper-binding protein